MRFQERIYIQTSHSCVRNKDNVNVRMSSEICEFSSPTFTMLGADKIMTGTTSFDDEIHIVSTASTIDLTFTFTGDTETFVDFDTTFKYDIYKYNPNTMVFSSPAIYSSGEISYDSFSATSAFTDSILVDTLLIDGEYLIKGSFMFNSCTPYFSLLGDNINTSRLSGDEYGLYDKDRDFYFAAIKEPVKPIFTLSPSDTRTLGSLIVESQEVTGGTQVTINTTWAGSPIVSLNGVTLSEGDEADYTTISSNTVLFNDNLSDGDIVTIAFINNGTTNGLILESILVYDPIPSGTTGNEGTNLYYYNTDISRFEIYTLAEPINFNDIIITLNGITLAINLDYYQSTVNPKRIILKGTILDGDIITITYNSYGSYVGTIYTDNFDIYWTVSPAPTNTNGLFTLYVAEDDTFSNVIYSATTPYVSNENTYSSNVDLSGYTGTTIVYKVTNEKDYNLISGDIISSLKDSDIIPITLDL